MPIARLKVTAVLEATIGGTRRHVLDLLQHLDRERFELELVCSLRRQPAFERDVEGLRAGGIAVTVMPMARRVAPLADLCALVRLRRHFRRTAPDIVHTHSSKAGFLGRLAARQAGIARTVYTPHCFAFEMRSSPWRRRFYLGVEKHALQWTSRLVCVCPEERDRAVQAGLASADRFTVIANGVPAGRSPPTAAAVAQWRQALAIPPGAKVVGAVGRLTAQKGYATLVAAATDVLARYPDTVFVVLGDGELRLELEAQCRGLRVETAFRFAGEVEDPWPAYAAFDVLALPSRWEALPYALLDAMSAGVPVVASAVGGVPGALEQGHAGRLVAPGDPVALAAALKELLAAPDTARALGRRAQAVANERYRLDRMIQQTEKLYAELADES